MIKKILSTCCLLMIVSASYAMSLKINNQSNATLTLKYLGNIASNASATFDIKPGYDAFHIMDPKGIGLSLVDIWVQPAPGGYESVRTNPPYKGQIVIKTTINKLNGKVYKGEQTGSANTTYDKGQKQPGEIELTIKNK